MRPREQHVQRTWGRKELYTCEDLKESQNDWGVVRNI